MIHEDFDQTMQVANNSPRYRDALQNLYFSCNHFNVEPLKLLVLHLQKNPSNDLNLIMHYNSLQRKKNNKETSIFNLNNDYVVMSLFTKLARCIPNSTWTSLRVNCDATLLSTNRIVDAYHFICHNIKNHLQLVDVSTSTIENGKTVIKPVGAFVKNLSEAFILGLETYSLLGLLPEPKSKNDEKYIKVVTKNHWDAKPSPFGGSETSFSSTIIVKSMSQKVKFILPIGLICQDEKQAAPTKMQEIFADNLSKIESVKINSPHSKTTITAKLNHMLCVDQNSLDNFYFPFDLMIINKNTVMPLPREETLKQQKIIEILSRHPNAKYLKHDPKNRKSKKTVAIRKCPIHGGTGFYNLFASNINSDSECLLCCIAYGSESDILYELRNDLALMKVEMKQETDLLHCNIRLGNGIIVDLSAFNFVLMGNFQAVNEAFKEIMSKIKPKSKPVYVNFKNKRGPSGDHSEKVTIPKSSIFVSRASGNSFSRFFQNANTHLELFNKKTSQNSQDQPNTERTDPQSTEIPQNSQNQPNTERNDPQKTEIPNFFEILKREWKANEYIESMFDSTWFDHLKLQFEAVKKRLEKDDILRLPHYKDSQDKKSVKISDHPALNEARKDLVKNIDSFINTIRAIGENKLFDQAKSNEFKNYAKNLIQESFVEIFGSIYQTIAAILNNLLSTAEYGTCWSKWLEQTLHKNDLLGNNYRWQLLAEYVDKLWRIVNPHQYQDYLYLLRYQMWREMQDYNHGDVQNEGTEGLNSEETRISIGGTSKGGGRGETGDAAYAKQILCHLWVMRACRGRIFANKLTNAKSGDQVDMNFNSCSFKKGTFVIQTSSLTYNCAKNINNRLNKYLGDRTLFQNSSNIVKKGKNYVLKRTEYIKSDPFIILC
jgi:hypothetical protein